MSTNLGSKSSLRVCPKCNKVIGYNSYFGAYLCDCGYEDDSGFHERAAYYSSRSKGVFEVKGTQETYDKINEIRLTKGFFDDCRRVSEKLNKTHKLKEASQ